MGAILRAIQKRHVLEHLTNKGILPNYAFPETGVTLSATVRTRKSAGRSQKEETKAIEVVRPARSALRELARVLSPKGRAIVCVPTNTAREETIEFGAALPELNDHWRDYGRDVVQRFAAAGLVARTHRLSHDVPAEVFGRLALADERYRAGIASSLDVLDAQRSLFAAQQALVQVQSLRAQNLVAVYRVLGGGG